MTLDVAGGAILRVVTIELPDGTRADAGAIVAEANRVFLEIAGVTSIDAFVRADDDAFAPGCVLLVGLRDLDAVNTYVSDPVHRAFAGSGAGGHVETSRVSDANPSGVQEI